MNPPLRMILLGSLLLNLLLIGTLAGITAHRWMGPPRPEARAEEALASLPPERRHLIEDGMAGLRARDKAFDDENDKARDQLKQIFQQPQFDAAAYRQAMGHLFERRSAQRLEVVDVIARMAGSLDQRERIVLMQLLEAEHPHPPRRR